MKRMIITLICVMLLLSACGGGQTPAETTAEALSLNLENLYTELTTAPNVPEMLPLDGDMQLAFCGIRAEDCVRAKVAICADSLRTDEIWLLEAVDEAALARLQELAQTRLKAKADESITYSPEQYAVVQKAEILTLGNYFVLIVSPEVETLVQMVHAAAGN